MRFLITLGQIPSKLDDVKFIGNKFRGESILSLAESLSYDHAQQVTIVKWRYNKINIDNVKFLKEVIDVEDCNDYYDKILELIKPSKDKFDCIILGAAIANLEPVSPFKGKFPSHNYTERDTIPINFRLTKRVITKIKEVNPRITLIGFKCSTGSFLDGIDLQKETKADLIIWNNPKDINKCTLCYKTGYHLHKDRKVILKDILGITINKLNIMKSEAVVDLFKSTLNIKNLYTMDSGYSMNISDLNVNMLAKYIELKKYVFKDSHGCIFIKNGNQFLMTPRNYDRDVYVIWGLIAGNGDSIYRLIKIDYLRKDNVYYDDVKWNQAMPALLTLNGDFKDKDVYLIHSHQVTRLASDFEEAGYIQPNCMMLESKSSKIFSEGAGYFMYDNNFSEVIKYYTDRIWNSYTPPKRYVRIEDHKEKCYYVGGAELTDEQHNIDPYFSNELISVGDIKDSKIKFKNSLPIVGYELLNMLINTNKVKEFEFNFPKQWNTLRVEECIDGKNSLELSISNGKMVAHCLVRDCTKDDQEMFLKDLNVIHMYDQINLEELYYRYKQLYQFEVEETDSSYHVKMTKIES